MICVEAVPEIRCIAFVLETVEILVVRKTSRIVDIREAIGPVLRILKAVTEPFVAAADARYSPRGVVGAVGKFAIELCRATALPGKNLYDSTNRVRAVKR